ncbi:MAG: hypothetical protein ACRCS0_09940, partial [Albidovulum sp.]
EVAAASVDDVSDDIADGIAAVAAEFEAETIDAGEPVAEAPVAEASVVEEPTLAEAPDAVVARLSELIASDVGATDLYDEDEADLTPAASWTEEDSISDPALEAEAAPFIEAEADFVAEADLPDLDAVAEDAVVEDALVEDAPVAADADLSEASSEEDLALLAELDGIAAEEALALASVDEPLPEDASAEITLADAVLQDPLPEAEVAAFAEDGLEPVVEAATAEAPVPEVAAEADEPAPTAEKPRSRSRRVNSRVVRLHPGDDASGSDDYDFGATRVLASTDESEEIARLMQQADDVMAEDENRRRQEALSRLKAAVASTEADRADIDYEAPKADVHLDPYRDDLAEAIQPDAAPAPQPEPEVKPRRKSVTIRPQEPRPGTIRPGMISPPPLVLVSEQRIDRVAPPAAAPAPAPSMAPAAPGISPSLPEGQPTVALRTGRLSGAIGAGAAVAASGMPARNIVLEKPSYGPAAEPEEDEDLAEDSREIDESGLAAFAEIVGARSMAEMLEAAAAYATCVENRSQFTRPQLMRRMMASAGGKPVSREDGLRSFGTLLRTGRIEKVTRGHYSLADNSPYLAEARRLS